MRSSSSPRFVGRVLQTGRADRGAARPVRGAVAARRIPGAEPGPAAAPGVGRAGVGRGPAGQGRARARVTELRQRWLGRVGRARLPRPRQAGPARAAAGRALDRDAPRSRGASPGWARRGRRGTPPTCAARSSSCSPAPGIVADAGGARSSWPRTSPPARSSCACRCASSRRPSTSGRSPPGTSSTWRPTSSPGSPRAAPLPASPRSSRLWSNGLDAGQRAAVAALAGDARLVVMEGAAGAGKTTTLAAARDALAEQHGRPTGGGDTDAEGGAGRQPPRSAPAPGRRRGWPASTAGAGTRPAPGPATPATPTRHRHGYAARRCRRPGICCSSTRPGMLDQDTARALLTIADETGARVALVGDRHQLPAVGRGGVLDLAAPLGPPGRPRRPGHGAPVRPHRGRPHRTRHRVRATQPGDARRATTRPPCSTRCTPAARSPCTPARSSARDALADTRRGSATRRRHRVGGGRHPRAGRRAQRRDPRPARRRRRGRRPPRAVTTRRAADRCRGRDRDPPQRPRPRRRQPRYLDGHPGRTATAGSPSPTPSAASRELPADYVRAHVELGYATTGYGAQGDTTDRRAPRADRHHHRGRGLRGDDPRPPSQHRAPRRRRPRRRPRAVGRRVRPGPGRPRAQRRRDAAAAPQPATPQRPSPPTPGRLADVLHELRHAWTEQLTARRQLQHLQHQLEHVRAQAAWSIHCQQAWPHWKQIASPPGSPPERAEQAATGCAAVLAEQRRAAHRPASPHLGRPVARRGPGRTHHRRRPRPPRDAPRPGPRRQAAPRRLGRHLVPDGRRRRPRPAAASSPPGRLPVHRAAGRLRAPPARPAVGRRRTPRSRPPDSVPPGRPARGTTRSRPPTTRPAANSNSSPTSPSTTQVPPS